MYANLINSFIIYIHLSPFFWKTLTNTVSSSPRQRKEQVYFIDSWKFRSQNRSAGRNVAWREAEQGCREKRGREGGRKRGSDAPKLVTAGM